VPIVRVDQMYLTSPNFASLDTFGPGGSHDTLMTAIVSGVYGSVLDLSLSSNNFLDVPPMTTQTLSFQLKDRSGNILSIIPNFSFVLLID
jgi:hypothetical protein